MATRITFRVNGRSRLGDGRDHAAVFDPTRVGVLEGVQRVEKEGDQVTVYGQGAQLIGAVVNTLETGGVAFHSLQTEQADLEDVFLSLTGREIDY